MIPIIKFKYIKVDFIGTEFLYNYTICIVELRDYRVIKRFPYKITELFVGTTYRREFDLSI